jgi:hypothetical protein
MRDQEYISNIKIKHNSLGLTEEKSKQKLIEFLIEDGYQVVT